MSAVPDRMQKLGDLPDIDPSADRRVVTPRPVYRDYGLLILPAATLDLDGIAEARLVLDLGERDIREYRAREAELASYDARSEQM